MIGRRKSAIARIAAVGLLRPLPQPQHIQQIARLLGHADDVAAQCLHAERAAHAPDRAIQFKRFDRGCELSLRAIDLLDHIQSAYRAASVAPLQSSDCAVGDEPGRLPQLGKNVAIDGRVLPNIELGGVEPKHLDLIDPAFALPASATSALPSASQCRCEFADVGQPVRRPKSSCRLARAMKL